MNEIAFWGMVIGFIGAPGFGLVAALIEAARAYHRDELSRRRYLRRPNLSAFSMKIVAGFAVLWMMSWPVFLVTS